MTLQNKNIKKTYLNDVLMYETKYANISFASTVTYNDYLSIEVTDSTNSPITNKSITVNMNGSDETITTDSSGVAEIQVKRPAGTYSVSVNVSGDEGYLETTKSQNVTVNKKTLETLVKCNTTEKTYPDNSFDIYYTIGTVDKNVSVEIYDGNTKLTTTVMNLQFPESVITSTLSTGTHTIKMVLVSDYYTATDKTITLTVKKATPSFAITKSWSSYKYGDTGKNIVIASSVAGTITYSGCKSGTVATTGQAYIDVSGLSAGNYIFRASFVPTDTINYKNISANSISFAVKKADTTVAISTNSLLCHDSVNWSIKRGSTELTSGGTVTVKLSKTAYDSWEQDTTYSDSTLRKLIYIHWSYVGNLYVEVIYNGDSNHNSSSVRKTIPITNVIFESADGTNMYHVSGNGTIQNKGTYSELTHSSGVVDVWEFGPELDLSNGHMIGVSCRYNISSNTQTEFAVGIRDIYDFGCMVDAYASGDTFMGEEWELGTWTSKGSATLAPPDGIRKALTLIANNANVYKNCSVRRTSSSWDSTIEGNVDWESKSSVFSLKSKAVIMLRGPACTDYKISNLRIWYL